MKNSHLRYDERFLFERERLLVDDGKGGRLLVQIEVCRLVVQRVDEGKGFALQRVDEGQRFALEGVDKGQGFGVEGDKWHLGWGLLFRMFGRLLDGGQLVVGGGDVRVTARYNLQQKCKP